MTITRSRRLCVVGLFALAGVAAASAYSHGSNGGANIASASTVAVGQQQFGNTTSGCYGNCYGADYWKLSLIAADHVTIDWETSPTNGCTNAASELWLWPIGTTDFSINNADTLQTFSVGNNHKAEATFTANATGVFPIMFRACYDISGGGPYDFTAYVRHIPRLSFPSPAAVGSGTAVMISARYADGSPISDPGLQVQVYGRWNRVSHLLGTAAPTNGQASVRLAIPKAQRGTTISLIASATGASYLAAHTPARVVHVH